MIFTEITYEDMMRIRVEEAQEIAAAEGLTEGLEQGLAKKAKEIAGELLSRGMTISEAAEITGLSEKDMKALAKKI